MASAITPIAVRFFGGSGGPDIAYTLESFPGGGPAAFYYGPDGNNWVSTIDSAADVYDAALAAFNAAAAVFDPISTDYLTWSPAFATFGLALDLYYVALRSGWW